MSAAQITADEAPGEPAAQLLARHYDELRRIARTLVLSDGLRRVMQPTELVNEAVLRLIRSGLQEVAGREHVLALASRTMRRALIDEARRARAAKRRPPTLLTRWPGAHAAGMHDVELLHEALAALDSFSPEHAQVVELRFGLGLTVEEAARASGIAERTLKRRWRAARAWLLDYLAKHDGRTVSS